MSLSLRILLAQIAVTSVASASFAAYGLHWGISALAGGLTGSVGSAWQAWVLTARGARKGIGAEGGPRRSPDDGSPDLQAASAAVSMVRSEVGKWLLTIALFAVVFGSYERVEPVALLVTFAAAQFAVVAGLAGGHRSRRRVG